MGEDLCPRFQAISADPMPAHALMFHHFHGGAHPKVQGAITADVLDRLIATLRKGSPLGATEWLDKATRGALEPDDVCLSFDDALRCQFDIALPVLEAHGLVAFWFVYTGVMEGDIQRLEIYRYFCNTAFPDMDAFYSAFDRALLAGPHADRALRELERFDAAAYLAEFPFYTPADRRFRFLRGDVLGPAHYEAVMDGMIAGAGLELTVLARDLWLTDDHLCDLADRGHVVGLHSHSHPTRIAALSAADQRREYGANHVHLRQALGRGPVVMADPSNSYNDETLGILRDLGVVAGFRASMAPVGGGALECPREDHTLALSRLGIA
ncbi:MAG: polysaccharide deacetylase family protein [Alphaproteobacteria bacterium]|nr:polysaccharide deacetylase family protein [Alphaproteobacteria bacterium]